MLEESPPSPPHHRRRDEPVWGNQCLLRDDDVRAWHVPTSLCATVAQPQPPRPPQDVTRFPLLAPGAAKTAPAVSGVQLPPLGCSAEGHHGVTFMGHPPWPGPGHSSARLSGGLFC